MDHSNTTHNIAHAAVGLALILLAQYLNKVIPAIPIFVGVQVGQLITGTLVNALLIIVSIDAGYHSGVLVGIISAFLATILGIGPIFPIITPFIAIANIIYVLVYRFGATHHYGVLISSIPAAFIKTGFLWITVPLVLTFIPDVKEVQAIALTAMFSWPQLITGIAGGIFAAIVIARIPKIAKESA